MFILSIEDIASIHVLLIAETGGSEGIRDVGRLEAVVAPQTQEVFGDETYKGLYKKAAAIIRGIIGDHPFVDGNKRTGLLAALTSLQKNDCNLSIEVGELEDFAVRVAVEHLNIKQISRWLEKHSLVK